MPRLVHLTRASNRRGIERAGIRGQRWIVAADAAEGVARERAVFAMPLLPDFATSHQWLRELKRGHDERMIAVHFVAESDEPVLVGRYGTPHTTLPLGEAIRVVRRAPAGAEIVLTRSIPRRDVIAIREVAQLVGWTEVPPGERRIDCSCMACLPPGSRDLMRRVRAAFARSILEARKATRGEEVAAALARTDVPLERARGRLSPAKLVAFARSPLDPVRDVVAARLGHFRWADVELPLSRLLHDPAREVQRSAARSIVRSAGLRRAFPLVLGAAEDARLSFVEELAYHRDVPTAVALLEKLARVSARPSLDAVRRSAGALLEDDELPVEQRTRLEAIAGTP